MSKRRMPQNRENCSGTVFVVEKQEEFWKRVLFNKSLLIVVFYYEIFNASLSRHNCDEHFLVGCIQNGAKTLFLQPKTA